MFDIPHDQLSRNKQLKESNVGRNGGTIKRQWGYYKVLHKGDGYTVKELTILPGKSLSDQRHAHRAEHWLVVKGELAVDLDYMVGHGVQEEYASVGESIDIGIGVWHRPYNAGTENVVVVETWIGESSESDIERRNQ